MRRTSPNTLLSLVSAALSTLYVWRWRDDVTLHQQYVSDIVASVKTAIHP
jgi:hypothetical protein